MASHSQCPPRLAETRRLTEYLEQSDLEALTAATETRFIKAAGNGTLSRTTLADWLQQDVFYTRAYIQFIGRLLNQLHLPLSTYEPSNDAGGRRDLSFKVFDLLLAALSNIQTETKFFDDTREKHRLFPESVGNAEPTHITQAYLDMFASVSSSGRSCENVLQGLVVLWATEHCYHRAWSHAAYLMKRKAPDTSTVGDHVAKEALRRDFIPNWSSEAFRTFVNQCGNALDQWYEKCIRSHSTAASQAILLRKCKQTYDHVLWLEQGFWPDPA